MEVADTDLLTFWYKVSSESGYDYLRFYIDGTKVGEWAGEISWTQFSTSIGAGVHTLLWSYEKDGSVSNGDDAGYIDFVDFPQQGTPGQPAIELDAASFTASLSADATTDQYLNIANNGDAELSYSINLVEGEKGATVQRVPQCPAPFLPSNLKKVRRMNVRPSTPSPVPVVPMHTAIAGPTAMKQADLFTTGPTFPAAAPLFPVLMTATAALTVLASTSTTMEILSTASGCAPMGL